MLVVAACQKNELVSSQGEEVVVDFFAQSIETKTVFGEPDGTTYPTLWTSNDTQVKVVVNSQNNATEANLNVSEDGKTATFSASLPKNVVAPFDFKVVSPASALIGYSTTNGVNVEVPIFQEPLPTSVDEKAQILYAVSDKYETWPSQPVQLKFSHLTAYGKMTITGLDESEISSVSLVSDLNWSGRWNYNGEEFIENAAANFISIKTDHLNDIWFACAPVDLSGKNLEIAVTTANGVYRKTINFTHGGTFASGKIAKFSVSFNGITPSTEQVVYKLVKSAAELKVGSEVIIAAKEFGYAISTMQATNNRAQAEIIKSEDGQRILNPTPVVQIFTLAEGTVANTYSFDTGKGYIYAAGGTKDNHLKTKAGKDGNASFSISVSDTGVARLEAQGTSTHNVLLYNSTSSVFACYQLTATYAPVALYVKDNGDTPTTPSIDVQDALELTAVEQDGEIAVTFKNFPDLELAAVNVYNDQSCTDECDWLIAYLNDGRTLIEYIVEANTTGSARTAYIKVECMDDSSEIVEKVVTVTQQKAEPVVLYNVTLKDDNTVLTQATSGASVTLPSRSTSVTGYTFCGWCEDNISTLTSTKPSIIPAGSYQPVADVELYPVFSISKGGTGEQWVKTAIADVTAGTYAIITTDGHAFNGNISSGHGQITSTAFKFDDNGIATSAPTGTIELTFAAVTGGYTIYNSGKGYLYATAASSGKLAWHNTESSYWRYGGENNNWIYNSNSAYLRDYQNASIRTYGNNSGSGPIGLAKKEGASLTTYYITSPQAEGDTPTKVLSSISVSGQTTSFYVGDTFSFGGTVTATYSDGTSANVTSSTSFTGYNMSTAGNYTVTASYSESGVTKTATYSITVSTKPTGSVTIAIDFSSINQKPSDMPGASTGVIKGIVKSYTIAGYEFSFYTPSNGSGFYWSGGQDNALNKYFYMGKTGAYIQFPIVSGRTLSKVIWSTSAGTSESVILNVTDDQNNIIYNNTTAAAKSTTYEWNLTNTVQSVAYRLRVTNNYNVQLTGLTLVYN